MIRGLYTSASGMLAELQRQDMVSNNLANVDTPGYKQDIMVFKSLPKLQIHRTHDVKVPVEDIQKPALRQIRIMRERMGEKVETGSYREIWPYIGPLGVGVGVDEVVINFAQGPVKETNNKFDFALKGNGFFKIQTQRGIRYTRSGNFALNKNGFLVTKDGDYVLGKRGPIRVIGSDLMVNEAGEVLVEDKVLTPEQRLQYQAQGLEKRGDKWVVNQFAIVDFQDRNVLVKEGHSLYKISNTAKNAKEIQGEAEVKQGFLEGAGVNVVQEMVDMINVARAYEANQRVIQTHDTMLDKAVNSVGRI